MSVARFWGKVNPFELFSEKKSWSKVYSTETFREILIRERALCDRNGHEFSVLIAETDKTRQDGTSTRLLINALKDRLRLTDAIGWFDQNKLGVLLPDTPAGGAWSIIEEIRKTIGLDDMALSFMVYTHPSTSMTDLDFWETVVRDFSSF